jgi:hypothetical protein
VKSNLDVSIFVDELNAHIEAFQDASDVASHALENDVVFHASFFILVNDVLKDNSDHSDHSNEESTPC